jgi:predicted nucleic acid-binding protein
MEEVLLVADASTLLNFLRVRRFDLLHDLGFRVRIVDAVYEEIQSEREQLDQLVEANKIRTLTLEGAAITGNVAKFLALGLGNGESFSFAAAIEFQAAIAIDDIRAEKKVKATAAGLRVVTSTDVVVAGIRANRLTLPEADLLKADWADNHRFRLKFNSFGDILELVAIGPGSTCQGPSRKNLEIQWVALPGRMGRGFGEAPA